MLCYNNLFFFQLVPPGLLVKTGQESPWKNQEIFHPNVTWKFLSELSLQIFKFDYVFFYLP